MFQLFSLTKIAFGPRSWTALLLIGAGCVLVAADARWVVGQTVAGTKAPSTGRDFRLNRHSIDSAEYLRSRLDSIGPSVESGRSASGSTVVATPITAITEPAFPELPEELRSYRQFDSGAARPTAAVASWEQRVGNISVQPIADGLVEPPIDALSRGEAPEPRTSEIPFTDLISDQAEQLLSREGTDSSVKIAILLATLSLAPAIILMTTCYVRIVVVLSLLRQAFGGQQLPSTQILTALSLFVTFLVMAPTWNQIKTNAVEPYASSEITWEEAWQRGLIPVKQFMSTQIGIAKNEDAVAMFYRYLPHQTGNKPESIQDVPINVLLPAYLVSELKVAFLLGFQIFLPFLIVDLVVSAVTVSMGMVMLPPTMVSFPMKLILFVMVDGWNLVVSMLLQSFGGSYG